LPVIIKIRELYIERDTIAVDARVDVRRVVNFATRPITAEMHFVTEMHFFQVATFQFKHTQVRDSVPVKIA